ncbi:6436_t:CDS:2, partial [Gigaspora rosea]
VKICENLNVDIKNKTHCEVDMDVDLLQSTNNFLDIQRTREAKTYIKYLALINGNQTCTFNNGNYEIDPQLLRKLFEVESILPLSEDNSCNVIFSSNSRKKSC